MKTLYQELYVWYSNQTDDTANNFFLNQKMVYE